MVSVGRFGRAALGIKTLRIALQHAQTHLRLSCYTLKKGNANKDSYINVILSHQSLTRLLLK